jgi:hypothetical protein
MARKGGLETAVKTMKDEATYRPQEFGSTDRSDMVTSAMHLPKATLQLLRKAAVARAGLRGGRPSVSAVIVDLVERHRDELEKEIGDR